jgi:hypothetical protein
MSVVVVIILIMAALIEQNFSRVKEGLAEKSFTAGLRSEVLRARVMAIQNGQTVVMQYDAAGSQITLSQPQNDNTDPNQTPTQVPVNTLQDQATTVVHQLAVPKSVQFDGFRTGTNDVGDGDWKLHFYSDGRSDGGGLQLRLGSQGQSLVVDKKGYPTYVTGSLPDPTTDNWPSGTYEQRTTTSTG